MVQCLNDLSSCFDFSSLTVLGRKQLFVVHSLFAQMVGGSPRNSAIVSVPSWSVCSFMCSSWVHMSESWFFSCERSCSRTECRMFAHLSSKVPSHNLFQISVMLFLPWSLEIIKLVYVERFQLIQCHVLDSPEMYPIARQRIQHVACIVLVYAI